jgi:hypothetical protein
MRAMLVGVIVVSAITIAAADPPKKPACTAAPLTDDQVKAVIAKERASRKDLPPAFKKSTWKIHRTGCYYWATEWMDPATPDADISFILNQHGAIVDVRIGLGQTSTIACPAKVYDDVELAAIVTKARVADGSLPPPFKTQRVATVRARCTYMYFEYRVPEKRGDYQLFQIDPLGEVMDVSISKPY